VGILKTLAASMWLTASFAAGAAMEAGLPTEYQLKAVFLFNFAQFVEWPAAAFAGDDAPLAICVLGQDPFGSDLDEAVRGESAMGRPLVVRRYAEAGEPGVGGCHILFVAPAHTGQLDAVLAHVKGHSTLVVSDTPQRGAVIGFVKERNRVRLRIDLAAANEAKLTISSKLLRLADVVGAAGG
jgi:hypothetical protein